MNIFIFILSLILLVILIALASINRKNDKRIQELEDKLYDEKIIVEQKTSDLRKANLTIQTLEESFDRQKLEYSKLADEHKCLNKLVQEKETKIIELEEQLKELKIISVNAEEPQVVAENATVEETLEVKETPKKRTTKKTSTKTTAKKTTKKTTKKGE